MSAPKDVTLYTHHLSNGGAERVVSELAARLDRTRFRVSLVIERPGTSYPVPVDVPITVTQSYTYRAAISSLIRKWRAHPPSIVVSHVTGANMVAVAARNKLRGTFPVVCVEHSMPTEYQEGIARRQSSSLEWRAFAFQCRRLYRKAERIVCVSEAGAQDVAHLTGLPSSRLDVIHNPVVTPELLRMSNEESEHPWIHNRGYRVVLGVGRLSWEKQFDLLIRAFACVAAQDSRARLILIGRGPEGDHLRELARALRVEQRVSMPGFVRNPFALMSRAAAVVVPSLVEGMPMVLIEALACGAPLIATDCPGSREALGNGRYGTLVAQGDSRSLAAAILSVFGNASEDWIAHEVADRFGAERAAAEYASLIDGVLDERGG